VVSRAETSAHLRKVPPPKNKWILWGGLLTLGLFTVAYMRWHAQQYKVVNILLEVTTDGEVLTERR
jgi:hypothetical protein